jgi:hypothetical protein
MIYVRKLTEADRPMAAAWLAEDECHQQSGITIDDFYAPNTTAAVIQDEDGPIQIVRFHKALRAAAQYNPKTRLRCARVGKEVKEWLEQIARENSAKEVIILPGGRAKKFTEHLGYLPFDGKVSYSGV